MKSYIQRPNNKTQPSVVCEPGCVSLVYVVWGQSSKNTTQNYSTIHIYGHFASAKCEGEQYLKSHTPLIEYGGDSPKIHILLKAYLRMKSILCRNPPTLFIVTNVT